MKQALIGFLIIGGIVATPAVFGEAPESAREAVRRADVAFDRAMAEKDLEAFSELVAVDAVFYGSKIAEGREAVVEGWQPFFAPDPDATLRWRPGFVEVSASGDLGYTRGEYEMTLRGENGVRQRLTGSYVTIWRRCEDGRWRAAVDIGTPPQPAAAAAAPATTDVN
jgi:uncharacterized protein (TIGR02246 family)